MNIFTVGVKLFSSERQTMTDRQTDRRDSEKKSLFLILRKRLKSGKIIRMYKKLITWRNSNAVAVVITLENIFHKEVQR